MGKLPVCPLPALFLSPVIVFPPRHERFTALESRVRGYDGDVLRRCAKETMRILKGTVEKGHGLRLASDFLAPVMGLIKSKMGFVSLVAGTLNVLISEDYFVEPDAIIPPDKYPYNQTHGTNETIKLKRCLIRGRKAIIMRPDSHEIPFENPGRKRLELMGAVPFRKEFDIPIGSHVAVEVEVEGDEAWWTSGI